uniref:F-box associated beta-propeller type 3 domain-containing protein n=1 Tax=Fagus sylvatica TaxID=28930 RepID=A0A2N9F3E7_FAGSY
MFCYTNFATAYAVCPIPFRTVTNHYRVLCSCNGVLCMSNSPIDTYFMCSSYDPPINDNLICITVYLWNPTVRKFKILPPYTPLGNKKLMSNTFGVGPDHRDHDFLVIKIIYFYDEYAGTYNGRRRPLTMVYSLNNKSWSSVAESVVVPCFAYDYPTAFVNGAIHWKAFSFALNEPVIMYFNTAERVFGEIRFPDNSFDPHMNRVHSRVAVFNGLLAFIVISTLHPAYREVCDIWVMNEYGVVESWTQRFAIPIPVAWFERPLGITKNNQLLVDLDGKLFWYDLDSHHCGILGYHGVQCSFDVETLTESLYLLKPSRQ